MHRAARARELAAALAIALAFPWLACSDALGPNEPFSLEFAPIPAPSIVSGDTLRDIDGNAIPLQATVYNSRGAELEDAEVSFVVVDTSGAITLDPATGHIVATGARRGTVRVVASVGALQSSPRTIEIVPMPSAVARFGTTDTLRYSFSNPALNTSAPLEVRVTRDSANAGVPLYLVRFRLANPADTIVARIVDEATRRSPLDPSGAMHVDTTESSGTRAGVAGRRIRLTPGISLGTPLDSIVVLADVRHRGVHVTGSPVRLVLYVKPITTTTP